MVKRKTICTSKIAQGLILQIKFLRFEFFFQINLKILNPQFFWKNLKKIRSDFLVQLAGQVSENKIQEFLIFQKSKIGSEFWKFIRFFLLVGSSPDGRTGTHEIFLQRVLSSNTRLGGLFFNRKKTIFQESTDTTFW